MDRQTSAQVQAVAGVENMGNERIDRILERYGCRHEEIIGILQEIQAEEKYLSEGTLRYVSEKMELSLTRLFDVATFYTGFTLKPKGRHVIKVCCGTPCHLSGSARLLDHLKNRLEIKEGEITADGEFTIEIVNCPGTCASAPLVMVDDDYHEHVSMNDVEGLIDKYRCK